MLFYTGITRSSSAVLSKQNAAIEKDGGVEKMDKIKAIGYKIRDALAGGDLSKFGALLDDHWKVKRGVTRVMTNDKVDHWYSMARQNGALGGKLCGAGGGGFLMLYAENGRAKLRAAMNRAGLVEHRFHFETEGSKIIYNV